MKENGIGPQDRLICFGQLLGMCDHISFPLGKLELLSYMVPFAFLHNILASYTCIKNVNVLKMIIFMKIIFKRPSRVLGVQVCTLWTSGGSPSLPLETGHGEPRSSKEGQEREIPSLAGTEAENPVWRAALQPRQGSSVRQCPKDVQR